MPGDITEKLNRYIEGLTSRLPQEPRGAMGQIQGVPQRLFALRNYLQTIAASGAEGLRRRWAWTQQQFNEFANSAEGQAMTAEVNAVIRHFNSNTPGCRLSTASMHRPLEAQIHLWNGNASVQRIGERLRQLCLVELRRSVTAQVTPPYLQPQQSQAGSHQSTTPPTLPVRQPAYPTLGPVTQQTPSYLQSGQTCAFPRQSVVPPQVAVYQELPTDQASLDRFRDFLIRQRLENPTNATPGLSRHGQARAVDFVVSGNTNLTTGNPGAWRATGMAQALANAIRGQGPHLRGPLPDPDEPWHYSYER